MPHPTEKTASFVDAFLEHLQIIADAREALRERGIEPALGEQSPRMIPAMATLQGMLAHSLTTTPAAREEFDAAYLEALYHPEPGIRAALQFYLNFALGYALSLHHAAPPVDGPFSYRITVGITCGLAMPENFVNGAFDGTTPIAAWVSEKLGVPEPDVAVLRYPVHPENVLFGIMDFAVACYATLDAALLAKANREPMLFDPADKVSFAPGDIYDHPRLFMVSLTLHSKENLLRVRDLLRPSNADNIVPTIIELPFTVNGDVRRTEARLMDIHWPLAAATDLCYVQTEVALTDAVLAALAAGTSLANIALHATCSEAANGELEWAVRLRDSVQDTELAELPCPSANQAPFFFERIALMLLRLDIHSMHINGKATALSIAPMP